MTDLVFDVETSGLIRNNAPLDDASQPHIVQIAAHLYDENRKKVAGLVTLIKPTTWSIEAGAEDRHGISTWECATYGINLVAAMVMFRELVTKVDNKIVAHNAAFDRKMINKSLLDLDSSGIWWANIDHKIFCTMEESTDVLQLPGKYGDWKYPDLDEAHKFFVPDDTARLRERRKIVHDAETDVEMTAQVFWGLEQRAANAKR